MQKWQENVDLVISYRYWGHFGLKCKLYTTFTCFTCTDKTYKYIKIMMLILGNHFRSLSYILVDNFFSFQRNTFKIHDYIFYKFYCLKTDNIFHDIIYPGKFKLFPFLINDILISFKMPFYETAKYWEIDDISRPHNFDSVELKQLFGRK